MSRTPLPYGVDDVSALARALAGELSTHAEAHAAPPGHQELLNMLARAAEYRNWQHFKAQSEALADLAARVAPTPPPVDLKRLAKIAGYFDDRGRLTRWPGKANHRVDCLWAMWSRLPARTSMHEREVNERLGAEHLFGDHALLRRELVDGGWMRRTQDGRDYRRLERSPPPEAEQLIRLLGERARRAAA